MQCTCALVVSTRKIECTASHCPNSNFTPFAGIADLFDGNIIDCKSVGLVTKHSPSAFQDAMVRPCTRVHGHAHTRTHAPNETQHAIRSAPPPPLQLPHTRLQRIAGVTDPGLCLFMDDSVKNIRTAHAEGWRAVLVGLVGRDDGQPIICEEADAAIASIHDLPSVLYTGEAAP